MKKLFNYIPSLHHKKNVKCKKIKWTNIFLWRDVCLNTCVCWSYTQQTQKATKKKLQTRNTLKLKHFETKWNLQKKDLPKIGIETWKTL
jgi:hypothetical protein